MSKKGVIIVLIAGIIIGLVIGLNFSIYTIVASGDRVLKMNRLSGETWVLYDNTFQLVEEGKPIVNKPNPIPQAQVEEQPQPKTPVRSQGINKFESDWFKLPSRLEQPENNVVLDNGRKDLRDYVDWYFSWSPVDEATEYNLVVIDNEKDLLARSTNEIDNVLSRYMESWRINITTTNTFYKHKLVDPISLHNGYRAEWNVRAKAKGEWQDWGQKRFFTVEPIDTDSPSLTKEEAENKIKERDSITNKERPLNADAKK